MPSKTGECAITTSPTSSFVQTETFELESIDSKPTALCFEDHRVRLYDVFDDLLLENQPATVPCCVSVLQGMQETTLAEFTAAVLNVPVDPTGISYSALIRQRGYLMTLSQAERIVDGINKEHGETVPMPGRDWRPEWESGALFFSERKEGDEVVLPLVGAWAKDGNWTPEVCYFDFHPHICAAKRWTILIPNYPSR